eukprot:3322047-Amphidinium_carterae.1
MRPLGRLAVTKTAATGRQASGWSFTLPCSSTTHSSGWTKAKKISGEEKLEPNGVFSAIRKLWSLTPCMTEQVGKVGHPLVVAVDDVSRAHFYGVCVREVYVS